MYCFHRECGLCIVFIGNVDCESFSQCHLSILTCDIEVGPRLRSWPDSVRREALIPTTVFFRHFGDNETTVGMYRSSCH